MTIARFNERNLLDFGLDRQTVAALRHVLTQTGAEIGATSLPSVVVEIVKIPALEAKTEVLDLRAALLADVVSASSADAPIVSLDVNRTLKAGATISGRVIGVTNNGIVAGTLNLWLSVAGVKVFSHAFTTPDIPGVNKGFAADFVLTVRAAGSAMAGGVLSLAYNAPTVLPAVSLAEFSVPTAGAEFVLGMNWTATNAANIATAKVAYLSADKL